MHVSLGLNNQELYVLLCTACCIAAFWFFELGLELRCPSRHNERMLIELEEQHLEMQQQIS